MARRFLGGQVSFWSRERVYLAEDALEIDQIDGYAGSRRRLLFDEITLVTRDRRRRRVRIFLAGFCGATFVALAIATPDGRAPLGALAAFFAAVLAVEAAIGVDVVTVFGKRGSAQMSFFFRKQRARAAFQTICAAAREAQEKGAPEPLRQ